ncbi:16S rRNA (cytosine(1402)-N(4))-methyltransferase RsmH [Pseudonocardiaceae bacterium YIM PH 21723]|nr:16S rRNA (cytosine(1402)-N(4))-methyltransferase RsmH [Pseudonocardiaceae bacterium YIM PH 21723]
MTADARHVPVLLERLVEVLAPAVEDREAVYVDATLGLGGHAEAMLSRFPQLTLVGLDRDPHALRLAGERLKPFGDRVHLVHTVYDGLGDALDGLGIEDADAMLFDLGVSSMQLDEADRGFAYAKDAPLDMRMNPDTGQTAADVLNGYSHGELARILHEYGEERFAGKIASAILRERVKEPFSTSGRLVELLYATIPAASRRTGGHPAKRTFQALRIEVNRELDVLRAAIPGALDRLAIGGRIAVMSYHSLEDRITKQSFAPLAKSTTPVDLPVELPGHGPQLKLLTRGGSEQATEAEIAENPRAQSVRLRVAQRIAKEGR